MISDTTVLEMSLVLVCIGVPILIKIIDVSFEPEIQKYFLQSFCIFLINWLFLERVLRTNKNLDLYMSIFFALCLFIINLISNDKFSMIVTQFIYKITSVLTILFFSVLFINHQFFSIMRIYRWHVGVILFREIVYVISLLFFIYEGYNLTILVNDEIHNFIYNKSVNYDDYLLPKINEFNKNSIFLSIFSCILTIIMPYFFNMRKNLENIYYKRRLPSKIIKIVVNSHDYNITDEFIICLLIIGILIYISMLYCLKTFCYLLQKLESYGNSEITIFICILFLMIVKRLFSNTSIMNSLLIT